VGKVVLLKPEEERTVSTVHPPAPQNLFAKSGGEQLRALGKQMSTQPRVYCPGSIGGPIIA